MMINEMTRGGKPLGGLPTNWSAANETATLDLLPAGGRVLIIDDDPTIAEGMRALLELDGRIVSSHPSLITVPMAIRAIDPDVILLDLSLPALSGSTFLRAGGRRTLKTDAPVILFSGRSRDELSQLAEDLGADGFISKGEELNDVILQVDGYVRLRRTLQSLARSTS